MKRTVVVLMVALLAASLAAPAAVGGVAASSAGDAQAVSNVNAAGAGVDVSCEYPQTHVDATGEEVTLDGEPDEVVALYPSDAQLAAEIGAESKVTGMPVSEFTESLDIEDVSDISQADGAQVDVEQVIALDPDVVLAANVALSQEGVLDTLRDAGITVYVLDQANSLEDVSEGVAMAGAVTGECEGAEETIEWMDDRIEILESATEDLEKPLAFYASDEDGWTPGSESFHHEILTLAGLENLGAELGNEAWAMVDPETIVAEDPEWVVHPDVADEPPLADSIESTTAMASGNVVAVDNNAIGQPGPNALFVIDTLLEAVHPDVYAEIEADLQAIDDEYQSDAESGDDADDGADDADDADDDTDESIPGFGVPVAIAALLAVAYHVRR
ncbi:PGF-CTERM-anchored ABC transporter substrate-binding protein [Halobacteria archaeon AArc-dxtr1]|nr:PGF-CTERM-anchored ABC transporter substrate-binding protein [Halobacteria archaeon AArc-dxtr1]